MKAMDHINHPGHPDHNPQRGLYWQWLSTVRDGGGRQPIIELQRRFSAAGQAMVSAWADYREDRSNREKLHRYLRATNRCETLRNAILCQMQARRETRRAA